MPTYHFRSDDSAAPVSDIRGRELADDQAALREAKDAAVQAASEDFAGDGTSVHVVVTVERDDGTPVATVMIRAEVTLPTASD